MRGYKGQRSEAKWEKGPITGEYTFEWGTISAELQPLSAMEASPIRKKYNALLVLKRQPDGSWKFHRAIWNEAPAESPAH
jgi:ketosteroid isomerase-like protein